MFRKSTLLAIALLFAGATSALAQTAPVRGRVETKDADGKAVGVANAVIDVYRTDINGKFPGSKTDKKGSFTFAGLPLGATFVLSVSAPGFQAAIQPNVKAGMEDLVIHMNAGDGKALTEAEVRESLKTGTAVSPSGEMTEEQKKEKEAYDKKVAEIKAKNEKIQKSTEVINAAIKEGGAAFAAKDYDTAIAKYKEGYEIDPEYVGSAPTMLNNMSIVMTMRAGDTYNKSASGDAAARTTARELVKRDMSEVIVNSEKVIKMIADAPANPDPVAQKNNESNKLIALANRAKAFKLMAQTSSDMSRGKEAKVAFDEYMAVETDPAKKARAQMDEAQTMQDSAEFQLAVDAYQKILETEPNNPDALAGMGLSMVAIGYLTMTGDPSANLPADEAKGKAQLQDAANYLQKFVDVAPPTHRLVESVKASIADLKNMNVAPVKGGKTTTPTKKKP